MSLTARMIHWVVVKRPQARAVDVLNNPVVTEESTAYSGKSRLIEERERVTSENNQVTFVTVFKLLVPAGTDVKERDRIASVQLENGQTLTDKFVVKSVIRRRFLYREHHVVVELERVT